MSESMRDRIARVLGVGEVHHPDQCDCSWDNWGEVDEPCTGLDAQVDAILAAFPQLAVEPTDAEVEAGARALWDARRSPTNHSWDAIVEGGINRPYATYPHIVDDVRREARAVLVAALEARTT